MENRLLVHEAAKVLGVTPERVRQLCDVGRLSCERGTMNIRLIPRASVEKLAEQRKRAQQRDARPT